MAMLKLATIRPGSIRTTLRDTSSRLFARVPKLLTATKEKLAAALRKAKELFVLPPEPIEGTCVVISELSARFVGTTVLAVALRLPVPVALFLALAVTLLSARHVMAGYFGNRLLRETGELLGGMVDP